MKFFFFFSCQAALLGHYHSFLSDPPQHKHTTYMEKQACQYAEGMDYFDYFNTLPSSLKSLKTMCHQNENGFAAYTLQVGPVEM